MKQNIIKYILPLLAFFAVAYPLWVVGSPMVWKLDGSLVQNLFPLLGICAFTIMWIHVVSGVFEQWLEKHFNLEKFVHLTSYLVLICIIAHPLIVLIGVKFNISLLLQGGTYIWLAIVGFLLLITYDIGKAMRKKDFFVKHWNKILFLSTIGFLLIFFHSLGLGSSLQTGFLRKLWIFYGVTGILATIYTYGIKKFLEK